MNVIFGVLIGAIIIGLNISVLAISWKHSKEIRANNPTYFGGEGEKGLGEVPSVKTGELPRF